MENSNVVFIRKRLKGQDFSAVCVDYQVGKTETFAHWHDACEILYVRKGEVREFSNNTWSRAVPGMMYFVPPGKIHCFITEDAAADKIVVGFSQNIVNTDEREKGGFFFPLEIQVNDKYCQFDIRDNERIKSLLWRLVEAESMKSPMSTLIQKACVLEIYAFILDCWEKEGILENIGKNPITERILSLFYENPLEAPGPYDMAKNLKISYSHMNSLLKKEVGLSYTEILMNTKLEMAKKLILSTDMSITDIAYASGFCDTSYFIKMFKKNTGVSPAKYRQNIKNNP